MSPAERKERTEKLLAAKGIGFFGGLPMTEPAEQVKLRSLDEVCTRAVAALLSTQLAIELSSGTPKGAAMFARLMQHFGVNDKLNAKEMRVYQVTASPQDLTDVVWEYECCWSLFWTLGLVDDITDASGICDCKRSIAFVSQTEDYEDFRSRCTLRSKDEILDMLDLYYRYHWAVVQHEHIDPNCPVGDLNGEVVFERRRGLEWLLCDTPDWHDISLDT